MNYSDIIVGGVLSTTRIRDVSVRDGWDVRSMNEGCACYSLSLRARVGYSPFGVRENRCGVGESKTHIRTEV